MKAPSPPDYVGCPVTVLDALQAGRTLRPVRWGLRDAVLAFLIEAVIVAFVGLGMHLVGASDGPTVIAATMAGWAAIVGWIWFATRQGGNGMVIDLGLRFTRSDVLTGIVGGAIALAVGALTGWVTSLVVGPVTSSAGDVVDQLLAAHDDASLLMFLVMAAILGPIVEELYLRGLLYGAIRKRGVGTGWTVVLTAIAFSIMHLEPIRLGMILAMGIVLGVVRARTGSTGASIVAHVVNNGAQVALVVLALGGVTP